jgi:holin-like protein
MRIARVLLGLAVLVAFQLAGTALVSLLHAPIPGSVAGMALLAGAIALGLVPLSLVRDASDLLLRHLAVLYVPAGVALVLYLGLLRAQWMAVTAAGVASLLAVLMVVALTVQRLERPR